MGFSNCNRHSNSHSKVKMDPGFRRDDEQKQSRSEKRKAESGKRKAKSGKQRKAKSGKRKSSEGEKQKAKREKKQNRNYDSALLRNLSSTPSSESKSL